MIRVIFATRFCFGTLSAMVWADDRAQVNDTAVRDAVSRSLSFLEKVRDEIYHYWGTAWAAIGLLETLGKSGLAACEDSAAEV